MNVSYFFLEYNSYDDLLLQRFKMLSTDTMLFLFTSDSFLLLRSIGALADSISCLMGTGLMVLGPSGVEGGLVSCSLAEAAAAAAAAAVEAANLSIKALCSARRSGLNRGDLAAADMGGAAAAAAAAAAWAAAA